MKFPLPSMLFVFGLLATGTVFFLYDLDVTADDANTPAGPDLAGLKVETEELSQKLYDKTSRHRLIAIDYELSESHSPEISKHREKVLRLLAESADEDAIQYVRSVFETDSEHRDEAAYALSEYAQLKPSDLHIWRFLIRSLTVVEGPQAVSVMKALARYRQRATNSRWIRRVILIGLKLPEADLPVAIKLLEHWTGVSVASLPQQKVAATDLRPSKETLARYQAWFRDKWPDELDPSWPKLPESSRWTYEEMHKKLSPLVFTAENIERGKLVYNKASCAKCHKKGDVGEKFGPDLSDIAGLRQRKEILEAILFPNLELNEDYPTVTVLTVSGKTYSGLMSAGKQDAIQIIGNDGKTNQIEKDDIELILPSKLSNMPAAALEPLTFQEICDLLAYLEHRINPKTPFHKPSE
ncbi:MAG: c-type cytochrome [Planctomycetaceae bacterium]|nr:c-type cytochrome [Planctomycetaceae bacterium]